MKKVVAAIDVIAVILMEGLRVWSSRISRQPIRESWSWSPRMINNNLTSEETMPNFRNYIYTKGLKEVKPDSVNIR